MSTTAEDLRKIMNLDPFAVHFSETFDPTTDSLEALRGAIDALEAGIFGYGVVAGAQIVEIDDKAEYAVELLNPGGAIIPALSITPGTYTIYRIRNGTKVTAYTHAASAAAGRVELDTPYAFAAGADAPPVYYWLPGDLFMLVFSGIVTTIGSTLTNFPDMILTGRIARDEEIENILEYTTAATLKNAIEDDDDSVYKRIGDPTGRTNFKSLYAMLELDDTANYNLDDILRTGYATAGANLGTGSIMERIGTIGNAAHNRSVLEGMGLPNTDLTTLYELIVHGYTTEGDAVKSGALIEKHNYLIDLVEDNVDSVLNRIGAFDGSETDAQSDIFKAIDPPADGHGIMTVLGKDDEDPTNAAWDTDHWEGTVLARLQKALLVLVNGTGSEIGANLSIIDLIGAFDGGADPQGDIYQALGVPDTNSIWSAVQYINDAACPVTPVAGSILNVLVEDIYGRTLGSQNLNGLLGVADAAGRSITANIGDFQAQLQLQSLLDALGIPDVAGKDLYTCIITDRLGAVGEAAAEAGTLLPRLKFYGEGIIKGTGTAIPDDNSLYDAIGLVLARGSNPSLYGMLGVPDTATYSLWANIGDFMGRTVSLDRTLMDVIGIPDDALGSLYDRLGVFTSVNNLKAILGAGFTPADNLFDSLGGYDADDSLKDHVDYIKTTAIPGAPLTKTINYYIQAIGSNDADNDFASPLVVSNPIGSVLERLQHLQQILDDNITDSTHSVEVAHGVAETSIATFTPHRNGKTGVEFDLSTLIAAGEGGTVTVRLKHMIDNVTVKTIDKQTFVIGVDEVHPTVEGWLDANNTNGAEITIQCSVAVTGPRSVAYKIVEAA